MIYIDLVRLDPEIAACVTRAVEAWPRPLPGQALFGATGLASLATEPLLHALLDAAPICDLEMERGDQPRAKANLREREPWYVCRHVPILGPEEIGLPTSRLFDRDWFRHHGEAAHVILHARKWGPR